MFEAQYLFAEQSVYSPWMSRNGDNAIIVADLVSVDKSVTLSVSLFEKNSEDTGDGSAVTGGALVSTTKGRTLKSYSGLKEMVRFKISAIEDASTGGLLFRMLDTVWYDTVNADTEI